MGQFGAVEIDINFETAELSDKICNGDLEGDVRAFIKKRVTGSFNFDIEELDWSGIWVGIKVTSNRVQNAEWMAEMIFEYLKETYPKELLELTAEVTSPTNFISYEKDVE